MTKLLEELKQLNEGNKTADEIIRYTWRMQMYFDTLNESLGSRDLIDLWPVGSNIQYGETVYHIVKDDKKHRLISVYRDNVTGRYEEPVTYITD